MDKNYFKILIRIAVIAAVFLLVNTLVYYFTSLKGQQESFIYPVAIVYLLFFVLSSVILGVLVRISKKNKEQLGYAFLLLTGGKMLVSYLFARPILSKTIEIPTEKVNFFAVFVLFLAIEAYYTARLLNNKQ